MILKVCLSFHELKHFICWSSHDSNKRPNMRGFSRVSCPQFTGVDIIWNHHLGLNEIFLVRKKQRKNTRNSRESWTAFDYSQWVWKAFINWFTVTIAPLHLCRIPELLRDWVVFRCLTPPPLCIFTVGQQMFSWLSPVFWAIYSASSLGMKASTPTNKPWTIWWRTVWALSSVVFELLATAAAYHIYQNMFAYIWIVKCWTPRNDNCVPEKGTCTFISHCLMLTNESSYLCMLAV